MSPAQTLKEVTQIRFENFQALFQSFKEDLWKTWPNEPERGMLKKFAERIGITHRYVSHINCQRKNMGHATARAIEAAVGLPTGWMDQDRSATATALLAAPALGIADPNSVPGEAEFLEACREIFRMNPVEGQAWLIRMMLDKNKTKKDEG